MIGRSARAAWRVLALGLKRGPPVAARLMQKGPSRRAEGPSDERTDISFYLMSTQTPLLQ